MSKTAQLAGFLLRLLAAVCAAPLIVGWQVAVAFLEAHVVPSFLLSLVLTGLGIGFAVLIGIAFTLYADPDNLFFGLAYRLNVVAGFTTALAVVATLTVASTWAFGSIAEQHTCTVSSLGTVEEPTSMTGGPGTSPLCGWSVPTDARTR